MRFLISILLLTTIYINLVFSQDCYYSLCVKEGERCDRNHYYNNSIPYRVYASCEYGTFCPEVDEPVCTKYVGLGETCGNLYQECGDGLSCYTVDDTGLSICQIRNYLSFGESCSNDYECIEDLMCKNGKCSEREVRQYCGNSDTTDGLCPVGTYCNTRYGEWNENQCAKWLQTGDECAWDSECAYDSICTYAKADSETTTCQKQLTKKVGEYCDRLTSGFSFPSNNRYECIAGLDCISYTCQKQKSSRLSGGESCRTWEDCESYECMCNNANDYNNNGTCLQDLDNFDSECNTAAQNLLECLISHSCSINVTPGPDSCIMKHCREQYCSGACYKNDDANSCGENPINSYCALSSSSITIPSFFGLVVLLVSLLI